MTYTVYADLMLACSICINVSVLAIATFLLNKKIKLLRLIVCSTLNAIFTQLIYVILLNSCMVLYQVLYVLSYILMTVIYFKSFRIRDIIFNLITIIGAMIVLYGAASLLLRDSLPTTASKLLLYVVFLTFIILFIISIILALRGLNKNVFSIELTFCKQSISVKGFMDTGNLLYDDVTKKHVIILDYSLMKYFFNNEAYKYFLSYHNTGIFDYEGFFNSTNQKLFPLKYSTINSKSSTMPAILLSKLRYVDYSEDVENVLAAISQNNLFSKKDYQVLLNEGLKPNRKENSND